MEGQKKRSFFQKLMGVEREEQNMNDNFNYYQEGEESYQPENMMNLPIEQQQNHENVINPTFQPNIQDQSQRINTTQIQPQISTPPAPEEDGNWVADQEGQLTIDVYQTDTDIVIKSTIAGVKPEDLDIQINNDMVTIRGERRKEDEIREEDYYYQECYWGAFSRSIILPVDVEANKAEALMKNGILTIKLPKAETARARKIQVRGY